MLARVSIRAKITILVAALLATLGMTGGLALLKMSSLHANTTEIAANRLPSVRVLGELKAEVVGYRNYVREHLLSETAEEKTKAEAKLATYAESIGKLRSKYATLISAAEERELFDEWSKLWSRYTETAERAIMLSRSAVGGYPHDARKLVVKTLSPTGTQADAVLEKDIELNNRGADEASVHADSSYRATLWLVVSLLCSAVLAGTIASYFVIRDISQGIASIIRPMQALGHGDLSANVPHQGDKTEIGSIADVLQVFKEALIAKKASDEAAAKEAEFKIARSHRVDAATRQFEASVGQIVKTVSSASTELEASAGTLSATAERAQELTTSVSAASEQASANVQSVASATEEMTSSIVEISRQVQQSARIASDAVDQARSTNDRVSELSQAASRIGDVIDLINTIAGQTNLLALNATIEAARAGDAGRGFAVVASEVKALAEQTAKATGEIGQQVAGIQTATNDSVRAIREIGETIGKMSEISSTIAAAVEEQGAATQEISRNVQEAARGTEQVSSNIVDVQRGAAETGLASSQVLSAAQSLSQDSSQLKLEVEKFLDTVRAA